MKNVTLVAIDFLTYDLTRYAIELSLRAFEPKEIVIISDREIYPGAKHVYHDQVAGMSEYANVMLKGTADHVNTDHALYVQWDGIAQRSNLWTDEFLEYDYIGAPWPWRPEGSNVGNGGFSLRSKRLLDICATDAQVSLTAGEPIAEDNIIGQLQRGYLETKGIKFAPTSLAKQFSYELGDYRESFGFHGLWNIVNNLSEQDLDYILPRIGYTGWNVHKWHHFLYALILKGNVAHLQHAIDQLKLNSPDLVSTLEQFLQSRGFVIKL